MNSPHAAVNSPHAATNSPHAAVNSPHAAVNSPHAALPGLDVNHAVDVTGPGQEGRTPEGERRKRLMRHFKELLQHYQV
eukprot:1178904-Prorocentrum_minimum.AAC.1